MNKYHDSIRHNTATDLPEQLNIKNVEEQNIIKEEISQKTILEKVANVKSISKKKWLNQLLTDTESSSIEQENRKIFLNNNIFRLCIKNGEYVYARANDIIMIESCDHMVKVYLGIDNKVKLTTRQSTLKDFLLKLPSLQFIRIGRFCAINIQRLSGGNCNKQTFEFDYKISIKPKHAVPNKIFTIIGN